MPGGPDGFSERLKDIDRLFEGRSQVHDALRRLVRGLEEAWINYAIYGGTAAHAHGHRQTTDDVDVLLTEDGLAEFRRRFADRYEATRFRRGRRFLDRENGVPIDIVVTGHCLGIRRPGVIAYPDPGEAATVIDNIRYVTLLWLIRLKLAMGRYRDLGDVAALIRIHHLDESFVDRLDPLVHQHYIECLEENRREAEFEAHED